MRKIPLLLVATAALVTVPMANAAGVDGLTLGVKKGTLGNGFEVSYFISPKLSVGVGVNSLSSSSSDTTDDIEYDVDLNLKTTALLANFHPMSGSFRITFGVMKNDNELKMEARPTSTYDVGDITYNAAQVGKLEAKIDFKNIAPYLGAGWSWTTDSGIGFSLDLGLLMQGEPNVELTSTGGLLSNDADFQAELEKEESSAEDDLSSFNRYPVVAGGLYYRF